MNTLNITPEDLKHADTEQLLSWLLASQPDSSDWLMLDDREPGCPQAHGATDGYWLNVDVRKVDCGYRERAAHLVYVLLRGQAVPGVRFSVQQLQVEEWEDEDGLPTPDEYLATATLEDGRVFHASRETMEDAMMVAYLMASLPHESTPPEVVTPEWVRTLLALATPGPWAYTEGVGLKHYVSSPPPGEDLGIALQELHWKDGREVPAAANARLIAAARDLGEAYLILQARLEGRANRWRKLEAQRRDWNGAYHCAWVRESELRQEAEAKLASLEAEYAQRP